MSPSGDYESEMAPTVFDDRDIEILLRGGAPEDRDLVALAPVIESLRAQGVQSPSEEEVRRVAAQAAGLARDASPFRPSPSAPSPVRWWRIPRFAGALAALVLLLGMTGVAVAASEAAPGDFLYGTKRALERVGLVSGGPPERLSEARLLAERGRAEEALTHAAQALSEHELEGADALLAAAERLRQLQADHSERSEQSTEALESVAEMLEWMAEPDVDFRGPEFGEGVAERAHGIGAKPDEPGTQDQEEEQGRGRDQGQGRGQGQGPPGGSPPGQNNDD